MLLRFSNPLLELGVRPRVVTTPVKVHGRSGTWSKTSTCENLHPDLRSMPTQMANSLRGAKKNHYFSTVRIPRLRESRRTNTDLTSFATWRQGRQGPSTPPIQGLVPASSVGIKSDQCLESDASPDLDPDQRKAPSPEEDLASQPPLESTRAIDEGQHGWPGPRSESPLEHVHRRAGHNVPPANVETFPKSYKLSIALPRPGGAQFASEMITISARRGGRLVIVADAWHLEHDCHYEWHVAFPQLDIDLGAVRARLGKDGDLVIDVPRRRR